MKRKAIGFTPSGEPVQQRASEDRMHEEHSGFDLARTLAARHNDPRIVERLFTLLDRCGAESVVVPRIADLGEYACPDQRSMLDHRELLGTSEKPARRPHFMICETAHEQATNIVPEQQRP